MQCLHLSSPASTRDPSPSILQLHCYFFPVQTHYQSFPAKLEGEKHHSVTYVTNTCARRQKIRLATVNKLMLMKLTNMSFWDGYRFKHMRQVFYKNSFKSFIIPRNVPFIHNMSDSFVRCPKMQRLVSKFVYSYKSSLLTPFII